MADKGCLRKLIVLKNAVATPSPSHFTDSLHSFFTGSLWEEYIWAGNYLSLIQSDKKLQSHPSHRSYPDSPHWPDLSQIHMPSMPLVLVGNYRCHQMTPSSKEYKPNTTVTLCSANRCILPLKKLQIMVLLAQSLWCLQMCNAMSNSYYQNLSWNFVPQPCQNVGL